MTHKHRKVEIFSAGCSVCNDIIDQIKAEACPSCEISVLDMKSVAVQNRAKSLHIKSVPTVVVDGKILDCCSNRGVDIESLRSAGLGQPIT